ncbi:hypothetical protein FTV88_0880 [Heliorestis convoluta]|uniref:Uncharacterized protein n=1 Tax=Heliorestis convoluta TaxID=356322 RepID=A0A5Q2N0G9_9FIRM|nr:hypothetical protein FTV88_0880 [Heliorestis convoluta]
MEIWKHINKSPSALFFMKPEPSNKTTKGGLNSNDRTKTSPRL